MQPQMFLVFHVDVITPSTRVGSIRVAQPVEMGLWYEHQKRCVRNAEERVRERLLEHGCVALSTKLGNVLVKEG